MSVNQTVKQESVTRERVKQTTFKQGLFVGVIVACSALGLATVWWNAAPETAFSYAAENDPVATREGLNQAKDLSQAFNFVAETMRPSVVTISSVKHIQPRIQRNRGRQLPPGIPEEFRQFFGDDLFNQMPQQPYDQRGLGSGVIVSEDGYILTNNHVIRDADEVNVTLYDERELRAKIVGYDAKTDLAVLKVDAKDLTPAKLGNSDLMKVGEWVLAIGSPFELEQTVTAGIISAKGRVTGIIGREGYEDFLQTDAAINPGNSGGPLVNMRGEVIGINTAIAARGGVGNIGIGFAIPSNMASNVMHSLITTGKVVRGWLGAAIQPLDAGLAESFGYEGRRGVLIGSVMPDSPAQKAGLREGDIVIELNGQKVQTTSQLRNGIAALAPNSKAQLVIFRNGKTQNIQVTVGELESENTLVSESAQPATSRDLGLAVQPLTPELAEQINHRGPAEGVVITEVAPGSVADRALLRPGDVIVSIGSTPIKNMSDYRKAADQLELKDGVRMQVMREGVKRFVFLRGSE